MYALFSIAAVPAKYWEDLKPEDFGYEAIATSSRDEEFREAGACAEPVLSLSAIVTAAFDTGGDMSNTFTEIQPPEWMLNLFKSIDALDLSAGSGFEIFDDHIVMQFGPSGATGIEDVKKFFVKLDEPFITKHLVDRVFQYGNAYFMQGSAELRRKNDPSGPMLSAAPLFNILWMNDAGKIIRYVVDFDPEAAAKSGAF
jgi:hypothetical protein